MREKKKCAKQSRNGEKAEERERNYKINTTKIAMNNAVQRGREGERKRWRKKIKAKRGKDSQERGNG